MDAVPAGAGADVNYGIAHAGGLGVEHFVLTADAEREGVDERIAIVTTLENTLAADGGDAETIAVVGDAADYAAENAAIARTGGGIVQTAEAERIEHGDGTRAHGEDVAQDSPDAGGCALERLDEAGVVVRLDFESDDVALADIDDAGVFARALDARSLPRVGSFLRCMRELL